MLMAKIVYNNGIMYTCDGFLLACGDGVALVLGNAPDACNDLHFGSRNGAGELPVADVILD